VNPNFDPMGINWNVTQSKIAIGSGGFAGKGFLKGTQTKFDLCLNKVPILFFVPLEKNTVG
jgi:cell division protein FtsW (lipid II flippase)